jgi:hypothetical protein
VSAFFYGPICPACATLGGHTAGCPWTMYAPASLPTEPAPVPVKRCECGSEKTYGPQATHSDWCPKGLR